MRIYFRLFLLLILFVAGCAPYQKHIQKGKLTPFIHPLPAVFRADLALKQCPATSFELVLRPDGLYFLQMEKSISGNDAVQAEIGVWRYNEEKEVVQLTSYDKAVRVLAIIGKQVLKLIKVSGGMMPSLIRYNFTLTDTEPTYEGGVRVQGMYSRKRGRGIFLECLSGVSFPLLNKNRAAEAEQAYQGILHGRSESLFVTLDVRFSSRSGRGDRLIPMRSVSLDPYRSCKGKERQIATIADNRWCLLEVDGKTPEQESLSKPPFLKVQSGEQLIQGVAGCNNFTGSWLFTDNNFIFSRIASTRMACPVGMEMEYAFLQALDHTRRYTIKGDILSLRDRRGKVLARLRHSRQLTDLDFTLSPTQEERGEGILPDENGIPESHSVEVEGLVPASVAVPPVEVIEEKIQRTTSPSRHKIKVLRAKKKVAVRPTAQTDILPDVAKKVVPVPGPKMPVPTAVNERPEEKAAPSSVPEKRETVTEQAVEKKEPVDNTEQASPQNNNAEEVAPSKVPVSPLENNGKQVPFEPEVIGNRNNGTASATGEKLSSDEALDEAVAQPVTQSGEEKGSQPSLPPIPEEENDGEEISPKPAATGSRDNVTPSESGEMSSTNNGAQPEMQSSDEKEVAPSLPPLLEVEDDENDEQEVQLSPLAVEQGGVTPTPESENKTSANEMVQSEAQDDVVEKNNSSTTSSPERENNALSLPHEDLL